MLVADIHQSELYPGDRRDDDVGSGHGRGYTINAPVPRGSDEEVWLSVLEHVIIPAGREYRPAVDPDLRGL